MSRKAAAVAPVILRTAGFKRQQLLVVHVTADDAREGAVEARMRHALADDAVIGDAIAVGADKSQRRAHDLADVVLGDRGDQHPRRALVRDQIVADEVDRVGPARRGERADGLARMSRQVRRDRDLHAVPGRDAAPIVEPVVGRSRRGCARAFRATPAAPASPRCRRLHPWRQQVLQRVAAGGIGIGVAIDRRPSARAASMIARMRAALPQLSRPEHFRCTISTWTPDVRATSIASSTASSTWFASSRRWVK